MHTVMGKNGKERATTLRDARKLNLFPSVTTIMSVQDKPMLTQWLINQLLEHCVKHPYSPYEHIVEEYKRLALVAMRKGGREAAERGTEIHNKLEKYFTIKNNYEDDAGCINDKDWCYISNSLYTINEAFGLGGWIPEATFANRGFAGCVDLHHPSKHIIIDFKTKDKEDINDVEQYDDHKMQLAAYQAGLKMPSNTRMFNLFINVNPNLPDKRKGECKLIECTNFSRYLDMFSCLHKFWNLKNNYYPEVQ